MTRGPRVDKQPHSTTTFVIEHDEDRACGWISPMLNPEMLLLPFGGTTLITIPVSLYLFLQGDNVKGIFMLIWGLGVVVTIDNVLKPLFIGTRIKLPMLILFFGILGGLAVFGALGLILGPVVFVLLAVLLDLYTEEYGVNE